jgi:hypothetical protein
MALLISAPLAVAVAVAGIMAGSASAGVTRHTAVARTVTLRTLVANVRVRTGPDLSARVTGHIKRRGTMVRIACYSDGSLLAGNPVWYRLSSPVRGYVTSYYMNSHYDPVAGVARCPAPGFSRAYRVLVAGVHIRFWPSATSTKLATLGRVGTMVTVNCYTFGQSIGGDRVWYHLTSPKRGFVSGSHLNTGRDPAHGIPACW